MNTKRQNILKTGSLWLTFTLLLALTPGLTAQENPEEMKRALEAEKRAIQAERQALEAEKMRMAQQKQMMQHPESAQDKEDRIESKKIAFLTTFLDLTPEEAQKFWPVYNQYEKEQRELHDKRREEVKAVHDKGLENASDKEVETVVDGEIAFAQRMLDIKKKYHARFREVLPVKKVAKLYHAEEQFKKRLLREIGDRHREGMKGRPHPPGMD